MKILRGFALASLMTLATGPVFAAGFSLNDVAGVMSGMQDGDETAATASTPQATGLLSALSVLNVTPEQAIGGTSAMLGLAKNQLSSTDYSQLTKDAPGLGMLSAGGGLGMLGGLLGGSSGKSSPLDSVLGNLDNVKNTNDLSSAFSALGMDGGMIGQFTPILLQFLGQQGVGGSLLNSLGGIWGADG
ncbi:hypothetical protein C1Y08_15085 [Pseudomonas sp. FW306-02-F02-AA]|uniref:DUF2780 domain-containing protein n=1 Tax=Pseudomonas fluorescens TaxID=294 RepID=A0A0N9VM58_PSEFL|nr:MULTISPECIES: DUF2780 domain-containing protein [Pseudomonas]ALI00921.1 hypothetical protein AO353_07610 [Pseudomonas fluorescens]PMZ02774.1 hypothetical protein C1Y07_18155 [Pseudomonas sp. FW306-02-F02-AB]PMZ09491.1 hypothetical protein C1Y06_13665 [Pseudomonas sp. FW306-02-H06C]PMZ15073.1 hypothetical protein C1Y08_15085 [Pseudomonas sp. FW306-02-F02-AA]PMZ23566.1 hypothetical protein C1Y09_01915 [Pseudomonas sp. FW306-02-F08-AA]